MTEDEVIQVLRKYFESLFPKACSNSLTQAQGATGKRDSPTLHDLRSIQVPDNGRMWQ